MSTPRGVADRSLGHVIMLVLSVFVLGITLTWTFLSMRVVMDVGGSCADGGPYVSSQPCPGGAGIIGLAIPVMLLAAFVGSFAAAAVRAPNLLVPMWLVLFGSLGWNFLAYGFADGGPVWGWVVCGVVFELMAAPAMWFIVLELRTSIVAWWLVYPFVGGLGAAVGVITFRAMS